MHEARGGVIVIALDLVIDILLDSLHVSINITYSAPLEALPTLGVMEAAERTTTGGSAKADHLCVLVHG